MVTDVGEKSGVADSKFIERVDVPRGSNPLTRNAVSSGEAVE